MTKESIERRADRVLAGCIPCTEDGKHVLMITSRTDPDLLVFPKGGVKVHESLEEGAVRETFEEAGVRGVVRDGPISISEIEWFEMVVTEEFSDWPEKLQRERIWVPNVINKCRALWKSY